MRQKKSIIPLYGVFPIIGCFVVNCLIYYGTRLIADPLKHYDFTTALDRAVPLLPEWTSVYLICYVFWIANYILIARQGKEHCMKFVTGEMLSRFVCGIFYLLLPTTNVRPELAPGFWSDVLGWVYHMDPATNLFPSIHCLVSWFCFIGIRGKEGVPKWYRAFSCGFAILIFVSTQFTKQHYLIDVIGAVVIAEVMYYIGRHTKLYRYVERFFDGMSGFVFGPKGTKERV